MPSTGRRRQKRPKRGANLEESDEVEMNSRSEGTDELLIDKARRKWNDKAEYELIKHWVTGERAEMEPDDIEREMFKIAREFMDASKLKKIPSHNHNPNNFHLWKFSRGGTRRKSGQNFKVYKCTTPLHVTLLCGNEVRRYCDSDGPVCCKTSGGMAQNALQQVVTRAGIISPARSTGT